MHISQGILTAVVLGAAHWLPAFAGTLPVHHMPRVDGKYQHPHNYVELNLDLWDPATYNATGLSAAELEKRTNVEGMP
jgi:hypothetical protein